MSEAGLPAAERGAERVDGRAGEPVDDRAAVCAAIEALRGASRGVAAHHLDACVKCGLCGQSCHIYLAEPTPENLPGVKVARVLDHYRRYHTFLGRFAPKLVGARDVTPQALDELAETVFGRCTGCGRCSLHCTVGLDISAVIRVGRKMLAAAGRTPEGLVRTVQNQLETGNQMAIPEAELPSTMEWLAEDVGMELGDDSLQIPIDKPGARVLYVINPREVNYFPLSLMAAAGVFHAAGESWTLASRFYDVTNYGFFAADDASAAELTRRVMQAARELEVEEVVLSECGHGYRSFRWEGPNWIEESYPLPVRSVLELLEEYLDDGRIQVDASRNAERVTLHDPCNLVRWGGIAEPQRRVLRRVAQDFVEMTPNRADNFCCGGGGGMLSTGEYAERRVRSGAVKAEQIRATGAKVVATPCHNCADQLLELNKKFGLGVEVQAVVELVYQAMDKPGCGDD